MILKIKSNHSANGENCRKASASDLVDLTQIRYFGNHRSIYPFISHTSTENVQQGFRVSDFCYICCARFHPHNINLFVMQDFTMVAWLFIPIVAPGSRGVTREGILFAAKQYISDEFVIFLNDSFYVTFNLGISIQTGSRTLYPVSTFRGVSQSTSSFCRDFNYSITEWPYLSGSPPPTSIYILYLRIKTQHRFRR